MGGDELCEHVVVLAGVLVPGHGVVQPLHHLQHLSHTLQVQVVQPGDDRGIQVIETFSTRRRPQ